MKAKNISDIFFSSSDVLSYNQTYNFVMSERSGGKSFDWKLRAINDYKKLGKQKVWVRREKVEFSEEFRTQFFVDIQYKFPEDNFEVKETEAGAIGLINGEPFIFFRALSLVLKHKSIPMPNVNFIVYDEFIINPNVGNYLKGEVFRLLELFHTIGRPTTQIVNGVEKLVDPKTRIVFLGNSISVVNPYFIQMSIKPNMQKEFTLFKDKKAVIQIWSGVEHKEYMRTTSLGQAIEGTDYGRYATENEFLLDRDVFISKKSSKARYLIGFRLNGNILGIWADYEQGLLYVNKQYDPNYKMIAITLDDHAPNMIAIQHYKRQHSYKVVRTAYENGLMRFDDHLTQQQFFEAFGYLSTR